MPESLKKQTISGVIWSSIERFSVQGIQFFIMIIMARLLTPNDYGLVGMLTIFIAIAQTLIDSGFSQALIRKQNRTETDNSTVFYFNIVVGLFIYLIFYIAAPWVADFYQTSSLTSIMRVISLGVIFNSLAVVQRALLTIRLDFKTQAKASLLAAILSGITGIIMAYIGFGVWSIVTQQLTNLSLNTLLLWIFAKWYPRGRFSKNSFRELFSFGSKLLASGLLDTLYRNIYLIVIGKLFTASKLGYYTRAQQFSDFPSSNLTGILQRVTYPVLCKIQDDKEKLAHAYRKILKISAFIIFPLMVGLSAVAEPFILLLLKEQWHFAAIILQIICFSAMWYPIHAINLNLLQVEGRSDLFLRLEIIKKILGVFILCLTIPLGLISMCYGQIASSLIALTINTYYTGKLINVGFIRQMKDLTPTLVLVLTMWVIIDFGVLPFCENNIMKLTGGILTGIIYYIGSAWIFKFDELKELYSILKRK
ncbi:lipopolysaccharide biosynthesis protein [Bacteroides mediterraneensis]|uniref:lipopolysaccharide biosynthesis protein n=1 Tax=Bacteroides mediterraneensis TaxID=1841856 RepID=UPI00195ADF63|nr:lipopolysaccharide biosynthesis protein [Bacteroides mediterraneensis]MBM6781266.1 lipopolysaccharide biosynthesis protein [Bacteroides mediterraneensis]